MRNSWICESEKTLVKNPILEIVVRECKSSETDKHHTFYAIKSNAWANVIPVTEDGQIVLVKQFRIGVEKHTYEIPGGVCDSIDPSPQATALREMSEETGYELVEGGRCLEIGSSYANPAILNNRHYCYVAGPVRLAKKQSLDPGEMIEVVTVPISEIPQWIQDGKLEHSLNLSGLMLFLMKTSSAAAQALTGELEAFVTVQTSTEHELKTGIKPTV